MSSRVFVDTNVFVYARDNRNLAKQAAAQEWLRALGDKQLGVASPQIVGEYLNALARGRIDIDPVHLRPSVGLIELWAVGETDGEAISRGWELRLLTGFQFWDCVVLAQAARIGCRYLLSEDYQHDRTVAGVTIISPFQVPPADILPAH